MSSLAFRHSTVEATEATAIRSNYIVYKASSEDPEYPARDMQIDYSNFVGNSDSELDEEYQRTTKGWHTKKFCSYP